MRHGQTSHPAGYAGDAQGQPAQAAEAQSGESDYAQIFDGLPAWAEAIRAVDTVAATEEDVAPPTLRSNQLMLQGLASRMVDSTEVPGGDNDKIPAGYTYLGQLIVHDLTQFSKAVAPWSRPDVARRNRTLRSPCLDLDCIYGLGPEASAVLYERPAKRASDYRYRFRLGKTADSHFARKSEIRAGCPHDLPRLTEGGDGLFGNGKNATADPVIADPRNDDHLIIAQLHLMFTRLHNRVADWAKSKGKSNRAAFAVARRFVIRCYQDVIKHDYLKRLLCTEVYEDFKRPQPKFVCLPADLPISKADALLPLEFTAAAGRIGHSMVRNAYILNSFLPSFLSPTSLEEVLGLSGFEMNEPLQAHWVVEWSKFFGTDAVLSRRITPFLSYVFRDLRLPFQPEPDGRLVFLDLWRSVGGGLPSGQALAERLNEHVMGEVEVRVLRDHRLLPSAFEHDLGTIAMPLQEFLEANPRLLSETPLFYYLLQEAAVLGNEGRHLGPLGSFITALTFRMALPDWDGDIGPVVSDMPSLVELLKDEAAFDAALDRFSRLESALSS